MNFLFLCYLFVAFTTLVVQHHSVMASEDCKDDRDWYFMANVKSGSNPVRKCAAVARDPDDRCETRVSPDGVYAWEACRATCGCDRQGSKSDEQEVQNDPTFQLSDAGDATTAADTTTADTGTVELNKEVVDSSSSPPPAGASTTPFAVTAVMVAMAVFGGAGYA